MSDEKALEAASKIYERLLAQGRPEADARRDAERWVADTWGIAVTLPAPLPVCEACGVGHEPGHPDCQPAPPPFFAPGRVVFVTWTRGSTASSTDQGRVWWDNSA